jgi:hypothetical protein
MNQENENLFLWILLAYGYVAGVHLEDIVDDHQLESSNARYQDVKGKA